VSPPGANDFDCRPDARHPQPVVLVNGTFETMDKNWVTMSPYLAGKGYCVCAFNYGNKATGPIGKHHDVDGFRRHLAVPGVRAAGGGVAVPEAAQPGRRH